MFGLLALAAPIDTLAPIETLVNLAPSVETLKCAANLPFLFMVEKTPSFLNALLPTFEELNSCQNKFCLANLHVSAQDAIPFVQHAPKSLTVSAGVCLPEHCHRNHIEEALSFLCLLPRCSLLPSRDLITLCSNMQPLMCDPHDRLKFQHRVSLECAAPTLLQMSLEDESADDFEDESPELQALFGDDQEENVARQEQVLAPLMAMSKDVEFSKDVELSKDVGLSEDVELGSEQLSDDDLELRGFEAIEACGTRYLRDLSALMYTGGLQDLGDYHRCVKHKTHNYCLVKYMFTVGYGVCLPKHCSQSKLANLVDFVCSIGAPANSPSANSPSANSAPANSPSNPLRTSCFDYINLIPLNFCLYTQLFGCGRPLDMQMFAGSNSTNKQFLNHGGVVGLMDGNLMNGGLMDGGFMNGGIMNSAVFRALSASVLQVDKSLLQDLQLEKHSQDDPQGTRSTSIASRRLQQAKIHGFAGTQLTCDVPIYHNDSIKYGAIAGLIVALCGCPSLAIFAARHKDHRGEYQSAPLGAEERRGSKTKQILQCFNPSEVLKSYRRNVENSMKSQFGFIAGFRVLSMAWIVLGHSFSFVATAMMLKNIAEAPSFLKKFDIQAVLSGAFAVDTFFFISGFILTALSESNHKSEGSWLKTFGWSIAHRWARLAPMLYTVLILYFFWVPLIGSGPLWPRMVDEIQNGYEEGCRRGWWKVALFINNLFNASECLPWAWYLANDFQFYLVGTLLLLLRRSTRTEPKSEIEMSPQRFTRPLSPRQFSSVPVYSTQSDSKPFWFVWAVLLIGSYASIAITTLQLGLSSSFSAFSTHTQAGKGMLDNWKNWGEFYFKPWNRIPPFLIGMAVAIYVVNHRSEHKDIKAREKPLQSKDTPSIQARLVEFEAPQGESPTILSHVLVFAGMVSMCFITYLSASETWWPRWFDVLYETIHKSLWAICVGWFAMAFSLKTDRLSRSVAQFLSSKPFATLSPLVFAVYLLHPIVQEVHTATHDDSINMSRMIGYCTSISYFVLSFAVAVPLVLLVEVPCTKAAKLIGL